MVRARGKRAAFRGEPVCNGLAVRHLLRGFECVRPACPFFTRVRRGWPDPRQHAFITTVWRGCAGLQRPIALQRLQPPAEVKLLAVIVNRPGGRLLVYA